MPARIWTPEELDKKAEEESSSEALTFMETLNAELLRAGVQGRKPQDGIMVNIPEKLQRASIEFVIMRAEKAGWKMEEHWGRATDSHYFIMTAKGENDG